MPLTMTPWGYSVNGSLPDLITTSEFNTLTGSKWASDPMLATAISAASAAIRDYCGWHVAPSLTCVAHCFGGGRMLHLPFRGVSSITKVEQNGVELPATAYRLDPRGLGEVYRTDGFYWCGLSWSYIDVTAIAGYDASAATLLKMAVVQTVGAALAGPLGVKEEHAGNVGITYSNPGGGIVLDSRVRACLDAYKVEEVA